MPLRFVATIKLKDTTASQLFKRLNSYSKQHPLYRSLQEFGKIPKSVFVLQYVGSVELRQQSGVSAGREVRARDRRIVPPPHQERHHLLELPLPLATNPRRTGQGTAAGPSRRHPSRIGRCLAAHQPARRVRFRGREAARFGRSRSAQNPSARGGLKLGVRLSAQTLAEMKVSRGRYDGFGTFV